MTTPQSVEEIVEEMLDMLYATNPNITSSELRQIIDELRVKYTNSLTTLLAADARIQAALAHGEKVGEERGRKEAVNDFQKVVGNQDYEWDHGERAWKEYLASSTPPTTTKE